MAERFHDKIAIVTGAAGGIGSATARRLAAEGALVVVSDLNADAGAALADQLAAEGAKAEARAADVSDRIACERLVAEVIEAHGRIDVLVNNAGIILRGDILNLTDEMWHKSFTVNLHSMFYLCRAAIPHMREAGGGAIVNTASQWGLYPAANHLAYNVSKASVASFTQNLARDCAPLNIRVNGVCPGEIHTPMLESGVTFRGGTMKEIHESVPLGRAGRPEEVAATIAFLASEEACYICGSLVELTGAKPVY